MLIVSPLRVDIFVAQLLLTLMWKPSLSQVFRVSWHQQMAPRPARAQSRPRPPRLPHTCVIKLIRVHRRAWAPRLWHYGLARIKLCQGDRSKHCAAAQMRWQITTEGCGPSPRHFLCAFHNAAQKLQKRLKRSVVTHASFCDVRLALSPV